MLSFQQLIRNIGKLSREISQHHHQSAQFEGKAPLDTFPLFYAKKYKSKRSLHRCLKAWQTHPRLQLDDRSRHLFRPIRFQIACVWLAELWSDKKWREENKAYVWVGKVCTGWDTLRQHQGIVSMACRAFLDSHWYYNFGSSVGGDRKVLREEGRKGGRKGNGRGRGWYCGDVGTDNLTKGGTRVTE